MKKLYVGNLPYSVKKEDLEKIFSEYGTVSEAILIEDRDTGRSKGFGFVEMDTPESADKAFKALDGKDIQGRNIKVNPAQPRAPRSNKKF